MSAALAIIIAGTVFLTLGIGSVVSEIRTRRLQAQWRAQFPEPKADDEDEEQWASRVTSR